MQIYSTDQFVVVREVNKSHIKLVRSLRLVVEGHVWLDHSKLILVAPSALCLEFIFHSTQCYYTQSNFRIGLLTHLLHLNTRSYSARLAQSQLVISKLLNEIQYCSLCNNNIQELTFCELKVTTLNAIYHYKDH